MNPYKIVRISENRKLAAQAARWFHEKWKGIPEEAYRESMAEGIQNPGGIPSWYVVLKENTEGENPVIIAGTGIIENDFHERKDLSPNVCALYVEETFRCRGIAGELLRCVCEDCKAAGIDTLYLITDHASFYERYGWEFLCMVKGEDGEISRMYVHRM